MSCNFLSFRKLHIH